jgi:hypothetical protein
MAKNGTPEIERYLLGDNPFIGVDHLSQERARERLNRLSVKRIVDVIDAAFESGAQGLLFSTHPIIYDALKLMKARSHPTVFGLYPLLPYAQEYVQIATERGVVGLVQEVLSKLTWKGKAEALVGGGLSLASFDPTRVLRTYIDAELDIVLRNAPSSATLKSVFLHEILTDLATSLQATDLIQEYAHHILDKYDVMPGFATRNFVRFAVFAKEIGLKLDEIAILTPFNKVGFQMNPSREACEQTVKQLENANVVAMSILAAGYLSLTDALTYLREYTSIKSFVVGTSNQVHAKETFSQMLSILG